MSRRVAVDRQPKVGHFDRGCPDVIGIVPEHQHIPECQITVDQLGGRRASIPEQIC